MAYFKVIKRKECWVLTFQGWMLACIVLFSSIIFYTMTIHPYLSVSKPVPAQILAVEEWISPHALEGAASEFKAHGYNLLVVLGDERRWVVPMLRGAGVDERKIVTIQFERVRKDRTFASAVALRNWLLSSGMSGKAVNVYTLGAHARRSWLLFSEALGPESPVGVISCENQDYDPKAWWESSEGFKTVIDETISYVYTRLYFLPAHKTVSSEQENQ